MNTKPERLPYVLISPARNEELYIEKTIQSVISQTVLPLKWVLVSDGSTDRTDEIVRGYLTANPWMQLVRLPDERDRSFAAKVTAFKAGYEEVKDLDYAIIGNLDADISFDPDYFEFLMGKFADDPKLGVAGTPFREESGYSSAEDSYEGGKHVAGGCQLFRRECFQDVGGYIPVKGGGIDWIAVTTARMKGWKTRSFQEKYFFHYRSLGTAERNRLGATFDYGKKDYYLGGHIVWELFRVMYRMIQKPYIAGGVALLSGYLWGGLTRMERPVSSELMKFHRREQMEKLKLILKSVLTRKKIDKYDSAE